MDKHEAIKKVEQMGEYEHFVNEPIPKLSVLNILNQLDEPQKVTIPHFVADWLKLSKSIGRSLFGAMRVFEKDDDVEKWLQWSENQELFARAWLDGYEVEKEKRYLVKMKGMASSFQFLKYNFITEKCYMGNDGELQHARLYHTHKELEEVGFSEVFNSTLFEVEEVTE